MLGMAIRHIPTNLSLGMASLPLGLFQVPTVFPSVPCELSTASATLLLHSFFCDVVCQLQWLDS